MLDWQVFVCAASQCASPVLREVNAVQLEAAVVPVAPAAVAVAPAGSLIPECSCTILQVPLHNSPQRAARASPFLHTRQPLYFKPLPSRFQAAFKPF